MSGIRYFWELMKFSFLLCLVFILALSECSSFLLKEEAVLSFNEKFSKKSFIVQKDIYPDFAQRDKRNNLLFKKGTELKIELEQNPDWIKLRGFSLKENEEQRNGKIIIFIARDFLSEEEQEAYSINKVEDKLNKLLKEVFVKVENKAKSN